MITTVIPSSTNRAAISRPMPVAAPVTTAVRLIALRLVISNDAASAVSLGDGDGPRRAHQRGVQHSLVRIDYGGLGPRLMVTNDKIRRG